MGSCGHRIAVGEADYGQRQSRGRGGRTDRTELEWHSAGYACGYVTEWMCTLRAGWRLLLLLSQPQNFALSPALVASVGPRDQHHRHPFDLVKKFNQNPINHHQIAISLYFPIMFKTQLTPEGLLLEDLRSHFAPRPCMPCAHCIMHSASNRHNAILSASHCPLRESPLALITHLGLSRPSRLPRLLHSLLTLILRLTSHLQHTKLMVDHLLFPPEPTPT